MLPNAQPKPLPHKVAKLKKATKGDTAEQRARTKVRQEDRYTCRVCRRRTMVVHEEKRRGAGGVVSLENSYLACDVVDGGLCHPLLQSRRVRAVMASGAEPFNAREDLLFEMTTAIAQLVFEQRPRPAHVRIVEDS